MSDTEGSKNTKGIFVTYELCFKTAFESFFIYYYFFFKVLDKIALLFMLFCGIF